MVRCDISMGIDKVYCTHTLLHPFWFIEQYTCLHESTPSFQNFINTIGAVWMAGILLIDAADLGIKGIRIALSQTIGRIFIEGIIGKVIYRHKLIKQPSALIMRISELSFNNRCIAGYFTIIALI